MVDGVETPFVDCVDGVMVTPYQIPDGLQISDGASCNAACAALGSGSCCEGTDACVGFIGEIFSYQCHSIDSIMYHELEYSHNSHTTMLIGHLLTLQYRQRMSRRIMYW